MATKKKATKAVASKRKPNLQPLRSYGNNNIYRAKNTISFGCGAVRVQKTDLLSLAKLKTPELSARVGTIVNNPNLRVLLNLSEKDFNTFLLMRKDKNLVEFIRVIQRLSHAARQYRTPKQILNISSKTLLRIVGNR